jgi:hypothetical protein
MGKEATRLRRTFTPQFRKDALPDNPSWDKGWSGYLAGKNSTQGGDR